jgi:hypothetical protein
MCATVIILRYPLLPLELETVHVGMTLRDGEGEVQHTL